MSILDKNGISWKRTEKPLSHFRKYGNGIPQIQKRTEESRKRNGSERDFFYPFSTLPVHKDKVEIKGLFGFKPPKQRLAKQAIPSVGFRPPGVTIVAWTRIYLPVTVQTRHAALRTPVDLGSWDLTRNRHSGGRHSSVLPKPRIATSGHTQRSPKAEILRSSPSVIVFFFIYSIDSFLSLTLSQGTGRVYIKS